MVAGTATYTYGTWIETDWLEVEDIEIAIPGLPTALDGFRIVQLSDFHLYPHTRLELIRKAVEESNLLKPDLAVLTGDFVLSTAQAIDDLAPVLASLNPRLGIFAILGNHDYWQGADVVTRGLETAGIPLLINRGVTLAHQNAAFHLAGVDDIWSGRPDLDAALAGATGDATGDTPVILLAHEPDFADRVAADGRVDLQLSGHSHGGQVRLPFLGAPFLPPYGRKYDLGHYTIGKMQLYTNRGLGVTAPIRLNCPPEVTLITLRCGEKRFV